MLQFLGKRELPEEEECEFDHGDIDNSTGRVFVAHTSTGTVNILDGKEGKWIESIPDCAGGSGVVFDPITKIVFAASRAEGHILAINPISLNVMNKFVTGKKPNGLAVDGKRGILMTADVGDNVARFHNQKTGEIVVTVKLSGRPRWSTYRKESDEYVINIMDPPGLEFISGKDFKRSRFLKVDQKGPHGLVIEGNIAYVACDDATMLTIDLESAKLVSITKLAGPPDVLWHNKKQNLIYCSIGDPGVVQVFDGQTLEMIQQVETEYGSHTLTFDENMQKLYTFLPESHSIGVYQA